MPGARMSEHIDHIPTPADAETDSFEDEVAPEALNLSATLLWAFALFAVAVLPWAVEKGRRDLGWVQEPWSWPFIALSVGLIGGAVLPLRFWVCERRRVLPLPLAGRLKAWAARLSTRGPFCLPRRRCSAGLHHRLTDLHAGALLDLGPARRQMAAHRPSVAVAIVLAFRVGLGIWFPFPPLMQLFPGWVAGVGGYL